MDPLVTRGYIWLPVVTFAVKLESLMVVVFNRGVKLEPLVAMWNFWLQVVFNRLFEEGGIHIVEHC